MGGEFGHRVEINTRQAVTLAGNKFRSLQALQAAGVPVPKFSKRFESEEWKCSTVLGRAFRHSRGTDIEIHDVRDLERNFNAPIVDYVIEYVKPHTEYRVHVIGGKILFAQKKYFREELWKQLSARHAYKDGGVELARFKEESQIIRNNEHGWGFHDMNDLKNVPEAIQSASISAVDALGLDFGAVDVISAAQTEKGKRGAFVLEINTAPGLRERNLQKYAQGLKAFLDS